MNSPSTSEISPRANWKTAGLLFLGSWIFFLIHIQFPRGHSFDEFHYIPAAKQWLQGGEVLNLEHPPLAKYFIAAGIGLWGDIPIGWRFFSSLFGAATLVGIWAWAEALTQSRRIALWVAGVTLCNQLLYVQARIGMLDTPMFAFAVWALVILTRALKGPQTASKWLAMGALFGLSIACKWFGVVIWGAAILLLVFMKGRGSLKGVSWGNLFLYCGVIPWGVYFFTFIPYFFGSGPLHSLSDWFNLQYTMYDSQLRVIRPHPYMSHAIDWLIPSRPIWYSFDKEGNSNEWVRGVLLLGNPLIMIGGLGALAACSLRWLKERSLELGLVLYFWFALFGSWFLIPRQIAFYYYYYPAGMLLGLALGLAVSDSRLREERLSFLRWSFLGASLGLFIYFYPILSALKIPIEAFRKWMWLQTWI